MNNPSTSVEMLFERAEAFSKTTKELFTLNSIEKSADVVSSLVTRIAIALVVGIIALIASIGIALWIGDLLGKSYYGFFLVVGCYALFAILLHRFRKPWIKDPVNNSVIAQLLKQNSE